MTTPTSTSPVTDTERQQTPTRTPAPTPHMPGPAFYTAPKNMLDLLRQTLGTISAMRERYGDVVSLPTLVGPWTLVFHPDGARRVLQENHRNYNKDVPDYHILSLMLGNGLLTNDGDSWLQQRRLMQPAFHRERIAGFGTLMAEATQAWLARWEADGVIGSGAPVDAAHEMAGLTLRIVSQALFGAQLPDETMERVSRSLTTANHLLSDAFYVPGLLTLPTPQRRRLRAAREELHAVVDEIVRQRRARPDQRDDLLAMLLDARDADTGARMSDQQIRDEVLTLLLAGHETTANALAWALHLLAQHPHDAARLREEYRRVLAGRPPRMEDLPHLPYTRMVLDETMRLYPPAWAVARRALDDDEIGGYHVPRRAYVIVAPYATHRHPDFWERPDAFDPERFAPEHAGARHRFAYFPFGGGPRLCIGNQFALAEGQLILAAILSRYDLRPASTAPVVPEPLVTLRPRGGLPMTLHRI